MTRITANIVSSAAIIFLGYFLFLIFLPFITPLVFAAVIVVLFYPMFLRFKLKMSPFFASLLSSIIVLFVIIIPAFAIAFGIVKETIHFVPTIGTLPLDKLIDNAHTYLGKLGIDIDLTIQDAAQQIAGQAGKLASQVIGDVWNIVIGILVAVLATFFFFRDGEIAIQLITRILPMNQKWNEILINEIGAMIKSNIAASFVAASIQGLVGGLTFAWLNLSAPILWGSVMGFFSLFPFIGSWLIWVPTAIGLGLAGRMWDMTILVIVGLFVVNPIDNILRPAIVAASSSLNGLLLLIGLLGGVSAFGVSGLLLGPVLITGAYTLLKSSTHNLTK